MSHARTVRQFVDEINRLSGDDSLRIVYSFWWRSTEIHSKWGARLSVSPGNEDRLMAPAEQVAILTEVGLEGLIPALGLDVPIEID
jgi:hypothetical protein